MTLAQWGTLAFGAVIGWYLYFINRYRKADVQIGDLTTVIGAIGGGAVLKIISPSTDDASLFGAYGIGIAAGFFGYFLTLIFLVAQSKAFNVDWFLDGRRENPPQGWGYGTQNQEPVRTMAAVAPAGAGAGSTQNFYFAPQPAPMAAGDAKVELPITAGH